MMLSALDPLGLPLVTQVVAGKAADDPLYLPAIKQVSQSLPGHGVLYVGDLGLNLLNRPENDRTMSFKIQFSRAF
jgi:transposase